MGYRLSKTMVLSSFSRKFRKLTQINPKWPYLVIFMKLSKFSEMIILRTTLNSFVVMINRFVMVIIDYKRYFKQKTSTVLWGIGSPRRCCCHRPRANFRKLTQIKHFIDIILHIIAIFWIFMKFPKMSEMKILRPTLISLVMVLNRFVMIMISINHKRHFKQKTSVVLWDTGIDSSRRCCCHDSRAKFRKLTQIEHFVDIYCTKPYTNCPY